MLSSCNYKAIAKENEKLEKKKLELAAEVARLKTKIEEDPDDHEALLEQAKDELEQAEKEHEYINSMLELLKAEHDEIEKKYAKDKANYVIKKWAQLTLWIFNS